MLLGVALGDAVGASLEFCQRDMWPAVTGPRGGGPFQLKPGEWTDDTSLTLCSALSFARCGGFDPEDHMRLFLRWRDEGYLSCKGYCFDIGNTTQRALSHYAATGEAFAGPKDKDTQSNGSLMRIAPAAAYGFGLPARAAGAVVRDCARLTHGHPVTISACELYAVVLCRLLGGAGTRTAFQHDYVPKGSELRAIAKCEFAGLTRKDLDSSGYVCGTLASAFWCLWHTESFEEAVLMAANLGDDADTVAAVCGGLAGACYGAGGIPPAWLAVLDCRTLIRGAARDLWLLNKKERERGR